MCMKRRRQSEEEMLSIRTCPTQTCDSNHREMVTITVRIAFTLTHNKPKNRAGINKKKTSKAQGLYNIYVTTEQS